MGVLGESGIEAQTQANSPAVSFVQLKTGTRTAGTPADQGLLTGQTAVGHPKAKSGRQLVFSIMVRDVPISSPQDIRLIDEDECAPAAATQQGY